MQRQYISFLIAPFTAWLATQLCPVCSVQPVMASQSVRSLIPCCAVLCRAVPCCPMLCCAVPCCAVLCHAVLWPAVLCCAVLCRAVLCCAMLCCGLLCLTAPCCAVLCHSVLCHAVLRCAVPCCAWCAMLCHAVQGGMIRYNHNAFWKQRVCPRHVDDGTIKCCSCNRWQPQGQQWVTQLDGRTVCLDCLTTIVRDTADAQPLYCQVGHCPPFQRFVNGLRGVGSSNSTVHVSPGRTLRAFSACCYMLKRHGSSNWTCVDAMCACWHPSCTVCLDSLFISARDAADAQALYHQTGLLTTVKPHTFCCKQAADSHCMHT